LSAQTAADSNNTARTVFIGRPRRDFTAKDAKSAKAEGRIDAF
jgi:hypothetical protein